MHNVLINWINGKPVYETGELVTPSYSRSGGQVYRIGQRFFVPQIDAQCQGGWFDTLTAAWSYCENAYYSFN